MPNDDLLHRGTTIGIVGVGHVGLAAAFALFHSRLASDIVLVDVDRKRAEGEAADLMHGQALVGRVGVRAGSFDDLATANIVIVTAGVGQRPGETRLDLLQRNVDVFREVTAQLDRVCPHATIVVATNPVDLMTMATQTLSSRPAHHVIGTGTMLDTARLRALVGERYGVDPQSVHGYVLGEHGDSEFTAWSTVSIGGSLLRDATVLGVPWDDDAMTELETSVRRAAYRIIEAKGYTNWAIGLVIEELVETIVGDRRSIQPVSVRLTGEYGIGGVCLSIPCRIGANGVETTVTPELTATERDSLRHSAEVLAQGWSSVIA
jgi:L-lactate dehydrogenase